MRRPDTDAAFSFNLPAAVEEPLAEIRDARVEDAAALLGIYAPYVHGTAVSPGRDEWMRLLIVL